MIITIAMATINILLVNYRHYRKQHKEMLKWLGITKESMMYKFHKKYSMSVDSFFISRSSVFFGSYMNNYSSIMVYNDYNFKKFDYLLDYLKSDKSKFGDSAVTRTEYSYSSRGVFLDIGFDITENGNVIDTVNISFVLSPMLISNDIFALIRDFITLTTAHIRSEEEELDDKEKEKLKSFTDVFVRMTFKYLEILKDEGHTIDDEKSLSNILSVTKSKKVFDYISEELRVEVNKNNEMKLLILKLGE